ncbi:FadR/GntR family transcriptional regulator [Niallia oryzisoli]|uniref:FadR/GntR family transcriptional regulator n=1 Tax=Niallia oryzisoli TaxID=1737571 RepID=UPI0037368E9A
MEKLMLPSHKVELLSIPEQIANSIKQMIIEGKIKRGDTLPSQLSLAKYFGVSRPTMKEAFTYLVDSRVIEPYNSQLGGYRVSDFLPEDVSNNIHELIMLSLHSKTITHPDIFELRKMIEIPSAGIAALKRTDKDLILLESCLSDIRNKELSAEDMLKIDATVHFLLAKCTHNPLTEAIMNAIIMTYQKNSPNILEEEKSYILIGITDVIEAIIEKDEGKAKKAMEEHLYYSRTYLQIKRLIS